MEHSKQMLLNLRHNENIPNIQKKPTHYTINI